MARRADVEWDLPDGRIQVEQAQLAVLMDIRRELKAINRVLKCPNFQHTLASIERNTTKRRRKTR